MSTKILIAALVLSAVVGCDESKGKAAKPATAAPSKPAPPAQQAAAPPPAPGDPIDVTAARLVLDYKRDEVGADDKYRNRVLLVTGTVGKVDQDTMGQDDQGFVLLNAPDGDVQADVGAASKRLKPGQKVTLRCTGGGFMADTALLDGCAVAAAPER